MRKKAYVSNLLFRMVSVFFSAVLLLLALLAHVNLMTTESRCQKLEQEIAAAELETEMLRVRLENRISLYELETLAINKLGMHRPSAEQLYFDMIPG